MPEIIRRGHEADVTFQNESYATEDLKVIRYEGSEGISELYRFVVEVQTDDANLDLATLVGLPGVLMVFHRLDGRAGATREPDQGACHQAAAHRAYSPVFCAVVLEAFRPG